MKTFLKHLKESLRNIGLVFFYFFLGTVVFVLPIYLKIEMPVLYVLFVLCCIKYLLDIKKDE